MRTRWVSVSFSSSILATSCRARLRASRSFFALYLHEEGVYAALAGELPLALVGRHLLRHALAGREVLRRYPRSSPRPSRLHRPSRASSSRATWRLSIHLIHRASTISPYYTSGTRGYTRAMR